MEQWKYENKEKEYRGVRRGLELKWGGGWVIRSETKA